MSEEDENRKIARNLVIRYQFVWGFTLYKFKDLSSQSELQFCDFISFHQDKMATLTRCIQSKFSIKITDIGFWLLMERCHHFGGKRQTLQSPTAWWVLCRTERWRRSPRVGVARHDIYFLKSTEVWWKSTQPLMTSPIARSNVEIKGSCLPFSP